jgi:hypothetical protein
MWSPTAVPLLHRQIFILAPRSSLQAPSYEYSLVSSPVITSSRLEMPHGKLEFWNFNIPPSERTTACPDFLHHVGDKDKRLIGRWDSDYERQSWETVQEIISR